MIGKIVTILFWILVIFTCIFFRSGDEDLKQDGITVFTFPNLFDAEVVQAFEKKTGIKVNFNYYETNEELFVKLAASNGKGYDLIVPSDYAIKILIDKKALQPLDKTKLNFLDTLQPQLIGHAYDPENTYSIPFQWEVLGFAVNNNLLPNFDGKWSSIFLNKGFMITMVRDPIEAINLTSHYLYGAKTHLTESQLEGVRTLLKKQRAWTTSYAAFRPDYFVAMNNSALALSLASYTFMTNALFPYVSFKLPEDYTYITIENIAIPKTTTKTDLVYTFLNDMYRPEAIAKSCDELLFYPPVKGVLEHMEHKIPAFEQTLEDLNDRQLYFYTNLASEEVARKLWVDVKASTY
ncbi:MAG: hypothetical protein SP1CHLAM54_09640 [Chlamydiia bacterium]|nr:hypothetical protein [Chlamydiia bacterium]MCH9615870.1 hypothetical protein [Chlamydiia bacterium]MCH9628727.1 hypothetical protein [Chlamydiia bacterium]